MSLYANMAHALRFLSADMIERAKSGHPGMPLGMADIATVLWTKFLRYDASNPTWFNRDRFILSNGHGSALLYSILYLAGFPDICVKDLKQFRQLGSKTAGHPERGLLQGIDFSTGPLGQGIASGVGMALAERLLNARFGDELVNHKTYVFVGDGCLMEGISEEAISLAGHWGLNKLIVLWDDNEITIDGSTHLATSTNMRARFEANGWQVLECDGMNQLSVAEALTAAQTATKPVFIDCHTVIGFGSPDKEGTSACHGAPLGAEQLQKMRERLEWPNEPFDIPMDVVSAWQMAGIRCQKEREAWEETLQNHPKAKEFLSYISGELPAHFAEQMQKIKEAFANESKPMATRKSSQKVLDKLVSVVPNLIGGSADLTPANYTNTGVSESVSKFNYNGNYINYGIREHAMAAIMNGISAHGGFIPYGGTFLSFVDYLKPSMRLAALMQLQILYVLTHDSIGVGEDGPTHQPIEQLAEMRATPNVYVFRPADTVETAECYEAALHYQGPSAFVLSRQELPVVRTDATENLSAKGAYVLRDVEHRDVTILATGSEVSLALKTADTLAEQGIQAAVVSMPCWALFDKQSADYQQNVLGSAPRVAVEAASSFGWYKYTAGGLVISLDHFGESAPGGQLFVKYGFTPASVAEKIKGILK